MIKNQYLYNALVTAVYDGDTVTVDIDLGLHVWVKAEKLRLHRINAPEIRGVEREQGLIARDWLRQKILNQPLVIETIQDTKGKYGRYLVELWLGEVNINDVLVSEGLAEYKAY
ncbi:MAG: thermonuclease family protein [Candidatus Thiodiazotropha sp. (ex Myrtea spinifera)]|nr:thermonuclease family protein [Candidatus Thiodiazotropha sp. (ex Myrtea spinifera)]MCU7828225.1 thermonuclease family protein [Candidatus Thiodiazotropha sp. (ex Myrtea sp. 'scaly one' KF741663)]